MSMKNRFRIMHKNGQFKVQKYNPDGGAKQIKVVAYRPPWFAFWEREEYTYHRQPENFWMDWFCQAFETADIIPCSQERVCRSELVANAYGTDQGLSQKFFESKESAEEAIRNCYGSTATIEEKDWEIV